MTGGGEKMLWMRVGAGRLLLQVSRHGPPAKNPN